jgi:DNA-directed RNA polymerase specialized sigma24 family protein
VALVVQHRARARRELDDCIARLGIHGPDFASQVGLWLCDSVRASQGVSEYADIELQSIMQKSFETINTEDRTLILLRIGRELPLAEIAAITNEPAGEIGIQRKVSLACQRLLKLFRRQRVNFDQDNT